jgi:hypothetical protein
MNAVTTNGRRFVEVYDHAQPSPGIQISAIEALATRRWVLFAEVRAAYGTENGIGVPKHLRTSALQVRACALVEDDRPPVRVDDLVLGRLHGGRT